MRILIACTASLNCAHRQCLLTSTSQLRLASGQAIQRYSSSSSSAASAAAVGGRAAGGDAAGAGAGAGVGAEAEDAATGDCAGPFSASSSSSTVAAWFPPTTASLRVRITRAAAASCAAAATTAGWAEGLIMLRGLPPLERFELVRFKGDFAGLAFSPPAAMAALISSSWRCSVSVGPATPCIADLKLALIISMSDLLSAECCRI
mmetsp:Transcript_34663/g.73811  ORF Transcript_34663/g.73811 Transcript_34663/m.73811 type:complete len:205 (+) Transcript_34663:300-914(+)